MKIAVVLFNLGGPDSLDAVKPFLRNLFSDPAIITLPTILRWPLARLIAGRRAGKARGIYAQIGGASPIVGQTEMQAQALQEALVPLGDSWDEWRCFVCMRYWHPMTHEVVQQVRRFAPEQIVLLPLYPQYSTTTTGSSFKAWDGAIARLGSATRRVKSYPIEPGFIAASVDLVKQGLAEAGTAQPVRVLFSAHGLPEKIIKAGDPYQKQIEQTAKAIAEQLGDGVDWTVCYQSRVGPLKWIGPSTESEIARAATDKKAIVLYPLSFVSEHSETLVELDIDYRKLATEAGVPKYVRVPTVGTHPKFIEGLARLVRDAL
ncbi:MAG: ferrochelatase [Proteobacteria bacterium]|nr:ferrochelatase [Pseudomonadota bacterium]